MRRTQRRPDAVGLAVCLGAFFAAVLRGALPMLVQRELFELLDVRKQPGPASIHYWRALKRMGHASPSASVLLQTEKWRREAMQQAADEAQHVLLDALGARRRHEAQIRQEELDELRGLRRGGQRGRLAHGACP